MPTEAFPAVEVLHVDASGCLAPGFVPGDTAFVQIAASTYPSPPSSATAANVFVYVSSPVSLIGCLQTAQGIYEDFLRAHNEGSKEDKI